MYQRFSKPILDVCVSLVLFVLLLPFLLLVAVCVAVAFKDNPFFTQKRPGYKSKLFTIYKFRTLPKNAPNIPRNEPSTTPIPWIGLFLRKHGWDELPQLWNVIKGDMSLVGPRPLLPEYLTRYSITQQDRHLVKPGITGLAQLKGRSSLEWGERLQTDLMYVAQISFHTDLKIVFKTVTLFIKGNLAEKPSHPSAGVFYRQ